jgi:hypothetical protein
MKLRVLAYTRSAPRPPEVFRKVAVLLATKWEPCAPVQFAEDCVIGGMKHVIGVMYS